MATALYADGTGTNSKELQGLQHIIQAGGLGTVGGINASTDAFWTNIVSTLGSITFEGGANAKSTLISAMHLHWLKLIRGADRPDYVVSNSTLHSEYWNALQAQERFINEDEASAGFMALKFMNADFFFDDQCPDRRTYWVNTDYLFFRPGRNRNFVPLPERASINQDAIVLPMVWAGNMTTSNRGLQGILGTLL